MSAGHFLILGGTGFLGPHIVRAALARGHRITLFNRGKTNPHLFPELKKLRGDRRKGDLAALEDPSLRFDAVIDTSGYVPRNVRKTARMLADRGSQYIFVSSISAYKDGSVTGINERSELGSIEQKLAESIKDRQGIMENYGPLKAMCEAEAEAAFPGRCTVIRPGLIVGPGD
ncbi:MAG: NAD-dependent epimerase/dehydratase family protein, partial [Nannocystaceae bacterium]